MATRIVGPIIKCNLNTSTSIVFQPYLTKVQDLFRVEMKLVSISQNEEEQKEKMTIKVHFNVECKQTDNYYASLHPRLMNIKWNNTFHIALPQIQFESEEKKSDNMLCCSKGDREQTTTSSLSIATSVMVHNIEDFGIHKTEAAHNLMVEADMTTTRQSYKFPDVLSNFYGISNSIISVADSVSDIMFIVFLYYFTQLENYQGNELKETEKTTNVLFIVSIGNLLSVAIVISLYLTEKMHTLSCLYRSLICVMFIILSPCMASFDWILQKIQSYNVDILILSPTSDGILLWFQQ
eukprot:302474_1